MDINIARIRIRNIPPTGDGEAGDRVRDDFPDAELFKVTTDTVVDDTVASEDIWLINMHQFLNIGLPPEDLSRDERKRLAVQSRHFCLIQDTLYHKGADGIWRHIVRSVEYGLLMDVFTLSPFVHTRLRLFM